MFILRRYKWHIHAGSWSLVNCWREGSTLPYKGCSWILMNVAVGLTAGLGLDGDRCIRVIPRQKHCSITRYSCSTVFVGLDSSKILTNLSLRMVWLEVVPVLLDILVKQKPFWLLWSHDRKGEYANYVGQKQPCSKKMAKNGVSALKNCGSAKNWPVFWQFWLMTMTHTELELRNRLDAVTISFNSCYFTGKYDKHFSRLRWR